MSPSSPSACGSVRRVDTFSLGVLVAAFLIIGVYATYALMRLFGDEPDNG